jgi:hypothetical protein
MADTVKGPFDVELEPLGGDAADWGGFDRRSIDKSFHGELEATSRGQMLAAGTEVRGSAAYVALERVTGELRGRRGTFVLQHSAVMDRGLPQLSIAVVPDSGTGELAGLSGRMQIEIREGGAHFYEFAFTLPAR